MQDDLPVVKRKAPVKTVRLAVGLIQDAGNFLLRRRPDKGLLAGMWEFPAFEVLDGENPADMLVHCVETVLGQKVAVKTVRWRIVHTFSHCQWQLEFYDCRLMEKQRIPDAANSRWVPRNEWPALSFAGPHRTIAGRLQDETVDRNGNPG